MYQCYVKCVRKGGGGGGKDSKSSVTQVTRSFYDRPTLFPKFFFLFSPQRGGGHEDKMMIDSKEKIWERERKKRDFFLWGRCTVQCYFSFFLFALWVRVSEWKSVSNFLGYRGSWKEPASNIWPKEGKKQQLCRTNSARSNLKTVFFPNWKFMTRPALSLSLFISFLSPFWFFSSFLFNSLSDCSDNAKYKVRPLISAQLANWPCKGSNETCAVPDVGGGDVQVVVVVVTSESPLMIGPHATCGK